MNRYCIMIIPADRITPIIAAISVHFGTEGSQGFSGRFASSATLTASTSVTSLICTAATSRMLLAMICALAGFGSFTVMLMIRVLEVFSTDTLARCCDAGRSGSRHGKRHRRCHWRFAPVYYDTRLDDGSSRSGSAYLQRQADYRHQQGIQGGRCLLYRRHPDAVRLSCNRYHHLCIRSVQNGLRTACLCLRRQSSGGPRFRHQHHCHPHFHVRHCRPAGWSVRLPDDLPRYHRPADRG